MLVIAEFAIGVAVGLVVKLVARARTVGNENLQLFPAQAYESIEFGTDFPTHGFDVLSLPPEFVVVESAGGEVISEDFYTVLGSSSKAIYQNGDYRGKTYSALSSPLYLCTVLIPSIAGGCFPFLKPLIGGNFNPLLCSGIIWLAITFSIRRD